MLPCGGIRPRLRVRRGSSSRSLSQPYAELQDVLELLVGVVPPGFVAEWMSRQIVLDLMPTAGAMRPDVIGIPLVAVDFSATDVTVTVRLLEHLLSLRGCQ